jgi:4-hydroxy-tetrahydrodipicolinate synthase
MITPFTAGGGRVDFDAAGEVAVQLVSAGNNGLVVSGTAGEASALTDDEKEQLVRVVRDAVGEQVKVVAGTGSNDTARSIQAARRAERAGADGQLVIAPYYNRPSQEGLLQHFTDVAAATELPVMLYDNPARTGLAIATDTLRRLAGNPAIVALKDAKADHAATTMVMSDTDIAVYSGDDGLALPWLAAGAAGLVSVSANVAPGAYRQLVDATLEGDLPRARQLHFLLAPLVRSIMNHVPPAVAAKHLMHRLGRLGCPSARGPLVEPTQKEFSEISVELAGTEWAVACAKRPSVSRFISR